jgi:phosphoglycolate phosphatase-like HAD superfamily hydrolase
MNLFELLKGELSALNITDKELVARYIYIRTGELFNYNPACEVADSQLLETMINEKINIYKITNFKLICYSWARMFKQLLNAFGIKAEEKKGFCHLYVEYEINNQTYVADLMKDYEDIFRIKFGLKTENNYQKEVTEKTKQSQIERWDKAIHYKKGITTEKVLEELKKELKEKYLDASDYIANCTKVISHLINIQRKNVTLGFISGRKYIHYLLKFFLEDYYQSCSSEFYNKDQGIYMTLYGIKTEKNTIYYIYQKRANGTYEMKEVPKHIIQFLLGLQTLEKIYTRNLTATL